MPSLLKIRIGSARNLPVMDRSSELADAYVEIKFADQETQKTEVKRKSLNPVWNEDFRFEVQDDSHLQDAPLEIKVYDHDILSSDDIIGSVYLDLNSLLLEESEGSQSIAGWFPIHDTLRGIRGELYLVVKLSVFGDLNPFRESSAGVAFFSVSCTPANYRIEAVCGFVEELVAEEDPEYHWADNFRTTRVSNDARQMLLYNMAGKVRRLLGRKVLDLGGNAVIGYRQHVDLEGQYGVVVRGYGTACVLARGREEGGASEHADSAGGLAGLAGLGGGPASTPPAAPRPPASSEDGPGTAADGPESGDLLPSATALRTGPPRPPSRPLPDLSGAGAVSTVSRGKGARRGTAGDDHGGRILGHRARSMVPGAAGGVGPLAPDSVPFVTLEAFPPGVLSRIGGMVTARAVKLLSSRDREETRDAWWAEVREEVRGHARSLRCTHIVGYRELVTIEDDLIVLSAYGTAAVLDWASRAGADREAAPGAPERDRDRDERAEGDPPQRRRRRRRVGFRRREPPCAMCHVPYQRRGAPFPMKLLPCGICGRKIVPEVLLATVEPPALLPVASRGRFVEARVCREKKKAGGESNAIAVSETIPFLEYDLYSQLMNKLMIQGMNMAFGITLQLVVGQTQIASMATCTAFYSPALPTPPLLRLSRNFQGSSASEVRLQELMAGILERSEANRRSVKREGEALAAARERQRPLVSRGFPALAAAAAAWNPSAALVARDEMEAALTGPTCSRRGGPSGARRLRAPPPPPPRRPRHALRRRRPRGRRQRVDAAALLLAGRRGGGRHRGGGRREGDSAPAGPSPRERERAHPQSRPRAGTASDSSPSSSSSSSGDEDFSQPGAAIDRAQSAAAGQDPRAAFVVEVDDENDAEALSVLMDRATPPGVRFLSSEQEPLSAWDWTAPSTLQLIVVARRITWASGSEGHCNPLFSSLFDDLYLSLAFKLRQLRPCRVTGLRSRVELPDEDVVQIVITCMALLETPIQEQVLPAPEAPTLDPAPSASPSGPAGTPPTSLSPAPSAPAPGGSAPRGSPPPPPAQAPPSSASPLAPLQRTDSQRSGGSGSSRSLAAGAAAAAARRTSSVTTAALALARRGQSLLSSLSGARRASSASNSASSSSSDEESPRPDLSVSRRWFSRGSKGGQDSTEYIELTSLSWIPGGKVERWLGRVDVHLIRESNEVRDEGGLSQFSHDFLTEANAIARARVAALGGNCILAYHISQWSIMDNESRNQAYTLICVSGDAVRIKYADDRASLGFSRVASASLRPSGYPRPGSYGSPPGSYGP
eukprot:tig00020816_g14112.t1